MTLNQIETLEFLDYLFEVLIRILGLSLTTIFIVAVVVVFVSVLYNFIKGNLKV